MNRYLIKFLPIVFFAMVSCSEYDKVNPDSSEDGNNQGSDPIPIPKCLVSTETDEYGNSTSYKYDTAKRVVFIESDIDEGFRGSIAYHGDSALLTFPDSSKGTFTMDNNGRVTKVEMSEESVQIEMTLTYNESGFLTMEVSRDKKTGQVIKEIQFTWEDNNVTREECRQYENGVMDYKEIVNIQYGSIPNMRSFGTISDAIEPRTAMLPSRKEAVEQNFDETGKVVSEWTWNSDHTYTLDMDDYPVYENIEYKGVNYEGMDYESYNSIVYTYTCF